MWTVTVSIGRNVSGVPMSAPMWLAFGDAVDRAVVDVVDDLRNLYVRRASSTGVWDGVEEDSRTWVAGVRHGMLVEGLEQVLAGLAVRYGQDAIAVTMGQTVMVGPRPEGGGAE